MTLELLAEGLRAKRTGRAKFMARCPAHRDRTPSLCLEEKNGRILIHCFAGCSQHEVVKALSRLGLWEPENLTPFERANRALDRFIHDEEIARLRYWSDRLDEAKASALEKENWKLWKTLCREQGKAARRMQELQGR